MVAVSRACLALQQQDVLPSLSGLGLPHTSASRSVLQQAITSDVATPTQMCHIMPSPVFSSNDTHHRYVRLLLPLHHLLSDSSDSNAMAAGYLACGGRIAGLSWVLLLCQKLASMEARLQRPRLDDDDTSQICTLLGQMEHFLGDLLFTFAAAARLVRDTNSWVVTYRVSYDA